MRERRRHHRALLGLTMTQGVGNKTIAKICERLNYDSSGVFELTKDELILSLKLSPERAAAISNFDEWNRVDRILEKSERMSCTMIGFGDPEYPPLLSKIHDPPAVLWTMGDLNALQKNILALVGTRNPSRYGSEQAVRWVERLSGRDICFCSGLARGIDTTVHQTALEKQETTAAVLGSGIDRIYPPENRKIVRKMIDTGGVILTEYPPGTLPERHHFPERNRIVSGLSMGVIIIESAIKGGSLITARLALDEGRELFLLPHALSNRKGEGCNHYIKIGNGKLIQTPQDLFDELPSLNRRPGHAAGFVSTERRQQHRWKTMSLDETSIKICEMLSASKDPLHMDQLIERSGLAMHQLVACLLPLELQNVLERRAGNLVKLL